MRLISLSFRKCDTPVCEKKKSREHHGDGKTNKNAPISGQSFIPAQRCHQNWRVGSSAPEQLAI